ncbi:MAG: ribosome maturation factor RimP [Balneolaceae bacterium]|nr:ribosome maturation factor RimP [Balneolaceae bacterium]
MTNKVLDQVKELAKSVLSRTDFFLVDVEVKGGSETIIWVYIDAEDRGVNMDECAEISNELGFVLDAHELIGGKYRLNVSSPGLSRPLTDRRQYPKNKGRKARIKYKADGEYRKLEGVLREIDTSDIIIEQEDGETAQLGSISW